MAPHEILPTILRDFPYALFGSMLVGGLCAFLGVYIVAKRVVFFGAVLTQVSLLGLAVTFLPFAAIPHTVGSLAFTLVTAVIISRLLTGKRVPRDAVLGVVFTSSVAVRILIMQKTPKVEVAEIEGLLRGDILFVTPELFYPMLGCAVGAGVLFLLFFKEFSFVTFDAETARTQGYRAGLWEMAFYVVAATVVSLATHMVGDIFVFGFLVLPPVAGLLLARRVSAVFAVSLAIGILCPVVGLSAAFLADVPASPAIVATAFAVLGAAWVMTLVARR